LQQREQRENEYNHEKCAIVAVDNYGIMEERKYALRVDEEEPSRRIRPVDDGDDYSEQPRKIRIVRDYSNYSDSDSD
jgi:hypothetical protein